MAAACGPAAYGGSGLRCAAISGSSPGRRRPPRPPAAPAPPPRCRASRSPRPGRPPGHRCAGPAPRPPRSPSAVIASMTTSAPLVSPPATTAPADAASAAMPRHELEHPADLEVAGSGEADQQGGRRARPWQRCRRDCAPRPCRRCPAAPTTPCGNACPRSACRRWRPRGHRERLPVPRRRRCRRSAPALPGSAFSMAAIKREFADVSDGDTCLPHAVQRASLVRSNLPPTVALRSHR